MNRAVVSIGVKKTGGLPELQAAVESATEFAKWAKELQKIPASRVKLITDAKGPVSRDRIFETVEKITQLGFIEQLIVYFSGHGINSGAFEQWLLSRAPDDSAAAVNVKGSEFGARFCGIGHVVLVSDACRTAADSIQAQRVTGGDIFPNPNTNGPERPVDQFFATRVGQPAFEVKTVEESTSRFRAAYSKVLLEALRGEVPALIEASEGAGFIRPRPLKHHLATAVPTFFSTLGLAGGVSSQPEARIESEPEAWIATLALPSAATMGAATPGAGTAADERKRGRATRRRGATRGGAERPRGERRDLGDRELPPLGVERRATAPSLEREASLELQAALSGPGKRKRGASTPEVVAKRARPQSDDQHRYEALVSTAQTTFGPDHMETECGIKVRGARIISAYARYADAKVGELGDVIRVNLESNRKGANVLVQIADGSVVVAPAYRDFLTGLSFDRNGNLEDVWCEPSANTTRWKEDERKVEEIRELRAVIAASTALGVFRLGEAEEGTALLDRLRQAKTVDPALAVYAAHAWNDRRMRAQIVDLQRHLDSSLGVRIFDVAMLAFTIGKKDGPREMYPCVPMLTQGWALLSPLGIVLPGGLGELRGELRPSLWTHFNPAVADRLRHVLRQGKVG